MAGFATNKGKMREIESYYRGVAAPVNFYLYLFKSAATLTVDTNTINDLTLAMECANYGGAVNIARNSTDWDTITEDDTLNVGFIQLRDIVFTATPGDILDLRWAVLTDANPTVLSREVLLCWDLTGGGGITVPLGQTLTLSNVERRTT